MKLIKPILFVLVFLSGFYLGNQYKLKASNFNITSVQIERTAPPDKTVDFNLFWKIWDILNNEYIDKTKLNAQKMVYGAISGMVASVGDPYTSFLSPTDNKLVQEDLSGDFDGIGIQIGFKGKQLTVIAPLPGTPAQRMGILAGDEIIGLKDEAKKIDMVTSGISLPEAVQIIRGKRGTKITLALQREGVTDPIIVDVVRDNIQVPSVTLNYVGKTSEIAHLQVLKFSGDTKKEWDEKVTEVLKSKVKYIIVDLRNNPGGYLQGAVDLSSDFVPVNTLIVVEEKSNGEKVNFNTESFPRLSKYPMIVLVNQGSASASEILAGALRDINKTKLIGNATFGKGTIQEPKQLDNGSGLHITVAKWLTPKGTWVHEKGLEPDYKVDDDTKTKEDEQLQKAIELIYNDFE